MHSKELLAKKSQHRLKAWRLLRQTRWDPLEGSDGAAKRLSLADHAVDGQKNAKANRKTASEVKIFSTSPRTQFKKS